MLKYEEIVTYALYSLRTVSKAHPILTTACSIARKAYSIHTHGVDNG